MSDKESDRAAHDVPEAFAGRKEADANCCDETGRNIDGGMGAQITPEMIEAGKEALLYAGFGGEYDNPCVNFEDAVVKIFQAMIDARHRTALGQEPRAR